MDYFNCKVDPAIANGKNTKDWFTSNINSTLFYAKNEDYNRMDLDSILSLYKFKITNLINVQYNRYRSELRNAYNYYITLIDVFQNFRNYFKYKVTNDIALEKNTILRNTDCRFMNKNSQIFYLVKQYVSEEIFGVGLLNMVKAFLIFVNICSMIVLHIKLRSHIEIQKIKRDIQTILARRKKKKDDRIEAREERRKKKLEKKQKKQSMDSNDYQTSPGKRKSDDSHSKKSQIDNIPPMTPSFVDDADKSGLTSKSNRKLIHAYDLQDQQLGKITEFLKQEDKDVDERLKNPYAKHFV
jgi:hypothetical protein